MGLLEDLVQLKFMAPMGESIGNVNQSIIADKSKPIIQDYLNQLQTNPDGTGRPGGAVGLDLSKPENIQKLQGIEGGTLNKLLGVSGYNTNTPQMQEVQSISDRLLKQGDISSQMAQRQAMSNWYNIRQNRQTSAYLEVANNMRDAVLTADKGTLMSKYRGELDKGLTNNDNLLDAATEAVSTKHSDWSKEDKDKEIQGLYDEMATKYKTKQDTINATNEKLKGEILDQAEQKQVDSELTQWQEKWQTNNKDNIKYLKNPELMQKDYKDAYIEQLRRMSIIHPKYTDRINSIIKQEQSDIFGLGNLLKNNSGSPKSSMRTVKEYNLPGSPNYQSQPTPKLGVAPPELGGPIDTAQAPLWLHDMLSRYSPAPKKEKK